MTSPYMVVDGLTWSDVTGPGTIGKAAIIVNKTGCCYNTQSHYSDGQVQFNLTLVCGCCFSSRSTIFNASNSPNLHFIPSTWFESGGGVLSLCSSPHYSTTPTTRWSTGWSLTISHSICDRSWIVATSRWSPRYDQSIFGSGRPHLE